MTRGAVADRVAAEERLLEAELAIVLGRAPRQRARAQRGGRWLAAALVLLSFGVVAGTWWLQRDGATPLQQQDALPEPVPLPREVAARRTAELDKLPADAVNVVGFFDAPTDLARAQRLQQVRRLAVWAYDASRGLGKLGALLGVHRAWSAPPDDVLAPLRELPHLEQLELANEFAVEGRHLAALRVAPALVDLSLGKAVRVDAALVDGLAALPHLRALELRGVALDRAAIALLAHVGLRELRLDHCAGIDGTSMAALGELRSLETVVLDGVGEPPLPRTPADIAAAATTWRPDGEAMSWLRVLPRLRAVRLHRCVVDDSVLAVLPDRIEELELYSASGFSADGLRSLSRIARLRSLRFRERSGYAIVEQHLVPPREAAAALAAVLGGVRLRRLDFSGVPTRELMQAVAAQPELLELTINSMLGDGALERLDLAPLAASPSLQRLRLTNQSHLDDRALEPLARCRTLRSLGAFSSGSITKAGAAAALPGVEIEVTSLEDALRAK